MRNTWLVYMWTCIVDMYYVIILKVNKSLFVFITRESPPATRRTTIMNSLRMSTDAAIGFLAKCKGCAPLAIMSLVDGKALESMGVMELMPASAMDPPVSCTYAHAKDDLLSTLHAMDSGMHVDFTKGWHMFNVRVTDTPSSRHHREGVTPPSEAKILAFNIWAGDSEYCARLASTPRTRELNAGALALALTPARDDNAPPTAAATNAASPGATASLLSDFAKVQKMFRCLTNISNRMAFMAYFVMMQRDEIQQLKRPKGPNGNK